MSQSHPVQHRTYGNWRIPRSAGVYGLSFQASVGLFVGLAVAVLLSFSGSIWPGLIVAVFTCVVVWVFAYKDIDHLSVADRIMERLVFMFTRRSFRNDLVGGLPAVPGVLAPLQIIESEDTLGREFGLIFPSKSSVAATIAVSLEGMDLHDSDHIDRMVAAWGQALTDLGSEPGIDCVVVTVESSRDRGANLRKEIGEGIDPNAPELAKAMLAEAMAEYPRGAAITRGWVTIVFSPKQMAIRLRDRTRLAHEVGARLVAISQSLLGTGAGSVRLVTALELKKILREAFDPDAASILDEIRTDIDLADVMPTMIAPRWDHMLHDGCITSCWTMTCAPRGVVQSGVLKRLLAPMPGISTKRVSIFYRPISAARAASIVESDRAKASAKLGQTSRTSARDVREALAAQKIADEEAMGAGLVDFGITLSATTGSGGDLSDLKAAVKALGASARLRLRPAYGVQEGVFVSTLPLGIRPWADVSTQGVKR